MDEFFAASALQHTRGKEVVIFVQHRELAVLAAVVNIAGRDHDILVHWAIVLVVVVVVLEFGYFGNITKIHPL